VKLHTDIADRFRQGMKLFVLAEDGSRRELQVEEFWPHKSYLVLKFAGVDSISHAEALLRCELQVPGDQRAQLEPGWTFISDLTGCTVFDGDREIGVVHEVQFGAGEAPLLIVKAGAKQFEIPYAEAFLKSVDLGQKQIHMALPEGLLDLNAPLTEEEKRQQESRRDSRPRLSGRAKPGSNL
jgi:16S rRNA processing protein RimM